MILWDENSASYNKGRYNSHLNRGGSLDEKKLAEQATGSVILITVFVLAGIFIAIFRKPMFMLPFMLITGLIGSLFGINGMAFAASLWLIAGFILAQAK